MNKHSVSLKPSLTGVSLFSSGGIGDLALEALGVDVIVANEIIEERASLFRHNFPDTDMICGDIWEKSDDIINRAQHRLQGASLDILLATPPCQGMSKNGRGKLLNEIRKGNKPLLDQRNQLIIPTIKIIKSLQPKLVILENVPEMENTVILVDGELVYIIDYIKSQLFPVYSGVARVVEFADYGVPQKRKRLITVFSRVAGFAERLVRGKSVFPTETHSQSDYLGRLPWVTVRDVIEGMPPLDAREKSTAASKEFLLHEVPLLDEDKYFWVSNTPPEKSAFDNQCAKCGHKSNPTHKAVRVDGINRGSVETPLYCVSCGTILSRPWVGRGDDRRLMKGFTSAYKRMSWDAPSSTLTTNFAYACSDNKLHPSQHRTLSIAEALHLHTVTDYEYRWLRHDGKAAKKQLIRDVIGESVPPKGLQILIGHFIKLLLDPGYQTSEEEILRQPLGQLNFF
ncbi:DNA (cytosine-5-)-methyltransferase [Hyphomicrobiales bacterium]|nr:DNA (cytosine-5-)-methyltransferase [Hyphomicrobiales bacterium]CAH1698505.1 DNA (cytosine-5-)-methyltransferase [Hyphomicrobiales bacterium]CAI0342154.1 DNA (cytosine-5)-methyltransferase 1 [Hyphomicrobiales bacterium]